MRAQKYGYGPPAIKRDPSRKQIRNALAFMAGESEMEQTAHRKTGKQKESLVNDSVKTWANSRNGILYRNRRGVAQLGNAKLPFGLGPNGYGDLVGYLTIEITPEMIGRKVAVFSMIENKTPTGHEAEHQEKMIREVRDAGGIAGFATGADVAEAIYQRWRDGR